VEVEGPLQQSDRLILEFVQGLPVVCPGRSPLRTLVELANSRFYSLFLLIL
jgi:hypothetical protein